MKYYKMLTVLKLHLPISYIGRLSHRAFSLLKKIVTTETFNGTHTHTHTHTNTHVQIHIICGEYEKYNY